MTPEQIDQVADLLADYEEAWNAHDAAAVRDALTEGFLLEGYSREGTQRTLDNMLDTFVDFDARVEYLGDPLITRTEGSALGGYDVSALWVETYWSPEEQAWYGITNYRVVEEDGALKIHRANPSASWFQY